jgi:cysteine desulfurase
MGLYLDHNASTPPAQEVVEAMLSWLGSAHSNPHSEHLHARRADKAIQSARSEIAELIGAAPEDIVLTSGATESNNLVLQGYLSNISGPKVLAVSTIEHKSVLETSIALGRQGATIISIPVDAVGRVNPDQIISMVQQNNNVIEPLISVMHSNNEIGTIQPILEIAKRTHLIGGFLHTDATQSVGKIPMNVMDENIDFMSISSHKIYGPTGIGALYIAPSLKGRLRPIMYGGGQQEGLRPGTVPPFLAVGFGRACRIAAERMESDARHYTNVVNIFLSSIQASGIDFVTLGDDDYALPGLLCLRFPGIDGSDLLNALGDDLYAATGSACTSGELKSSHVLKAIGLNEEQASEVIRLGFGRATSASDAQNAAQIISTKIHYLKNRQ